MNYVTSFSYCTGKWTDSHGVKCSINLIMPRISRADGFSQRACNSSDTEMSAVRVHAIIDTAVFQY
jgi:hypothetical protein